ncbi:MAG: hypothetical protein ACK5NJ_07980 [Citrobacter portucalensis]
MNKLIETRRRRVVQAKLDNGALFPVELSEELLTKALIKLFEGMIYDTHKRSEADSIIAGHYDDCTGVNKLTPYGVPFMDALIETLAEEAMKQRRNQLSNTDNKRLTR